MGIRGLTTFITNHSQFYLQHYELHDTYLVIDGNSILFQLYNWHARCNCVFGGDYDKYAQCVSHFFDELLKCNVIPLVIFDGGSEDKKLKTIISRTKEKIGIACSYIPYSQRRSKFFPMLMKEVFMNVMIEKGIKFAQCLFEADNSIAGIARLLNCPVLSFDSDFYIYGSLYIPFNTWQNNVVPNRYKHGYVKQCKIYYVEKLFHFYNGLNQSTLPLAAVLLGNDYVKQHNFRNFFRHLKLPRTGKKKYNEQQRRIDATFNWLRKYSLNQAVIGILSRLQKKERKRILNIIELVINSYINASLSVLVLLDVPLKNLSKTSLQELSQIYKFEGDIYNLTCTEEKLSETDESEDDETDETDIASLLEDRELGSNESLVNDLPQWFIHEFKLAKYPTYFLDLIIRKLYICSVQIEDYSNTSSITVSLRILGVIYNLLMSEMKGKKISMYYLSTENRKLKRFQLEYCDNISSYKLPFMSDLRKISITTRKHILDITLGITDESCINEFPSYWMLYIMTMKYWFDYHKGSSQYDCHIYALLFTMLFDIIDYKIGFCRSINYFQCKFDKKLQDIQHANKMENHSLQYPINITLIDAIHEVNENDCLMAASFLLSNFEMDIKLFEQPKRFNIAVVHAFAEFQYCLKHSIHLNALLGYPYEHMRIAKLFNGTMLYNLYSNFKKRDNIEVYINLILQNSPSLLRVFHMLLLRTKSLFGMTADKIGKEHKKQTTRCENIKCASKKKNCEEQTVQTIPASTDETLFHDENNRFSVLSS